MTRDEAKLLVDAITFRVQQYQAVTIVHARQLLGEERFAKLQQDKVRNLGPDAATLYPWNVLDYLGWPTPGSLEYRSAQELP